MIKIFNCLECMRQQIRLCSIKCLFLSVLSLWLIGFPGVVSAQVVDIPDPNLRAAIAQALDKAPEDPITRADMQRLVRLSASFRDITDLRGIEFATNLEGLYLFGNNISDIPAVANLTNLTGLDLGANNISDISPLANLTNLTWLQLTTKNISDISPLANLTNLTALQLLGNNNNNISDISPLASLTNLTLLEIPGYNISDISPLASLTNLTILNLHNTISDISPLASLTNLTRLNLGNNNISNIVPLIALTNLTALRLQNNNISDIETIERLMAQGTVVYFAGNPAFETPGPKIEDGWVWLIVPATDVSSGRDAARSGRDFLSEASGGTVTEADVALNGARAGTQVGDSVWTAASLDAADQDNLNAIVNDYNLGTDIRYPVAYGVVSIQSETQQQTRVYIGAGPVKVWLNGTLVHKDTNHRWVSDYETAVPVMLMPGENLLFIAAYRVYPSSRWGAFFGFQDGTVYTPGAPPDGGGLDVNGDGQVNVIDLAIVALFYGMRVPEGISSLPADVNTDGVVDLLDLTAVVQGIDAAGGGISGLSLQELKAAVLAAAEQAAEFEVIAGAPMGFGNPHQKALVGGIAYNNVTTALVDVKHLANGDARLGKALTVLSELLHLLTEMGTIPETTALLPNYPNPFNPETWIPYQLSKSADVTLHIHAVNGTLVRTLSLGHQPAGIYQSKSRAAYWDGKNASGEPVASGVYFYTLTAGDFTATRKLLIRK